MRSFIYQASATVEDATSGSDRDSAFIAGGTNLVDLMKLEVVSPKRLIDVNETAARGIEFGQEYLRIGALEKMSAVAEHPDVTGNFPVISQALLKSASAQIRNMASMGGNLLQRTRCGYYRDVATPCNKREPGSGCPAIDGYHRMHAIFGTSKNCIATHASDLAVALVAVDASIKLVSTGGERIVKLNDFYLVPGETPHIENLLTPGEFIAEIRVPRRARTRQSLYLKIRDRESYEFALTSAAVALDLDENRVRDLGLAVGGVGTIPWRLTNVEDSLRGRELNRERIESSAKLVTSGAQPLKQNAFKVDLVRRTLMRALMALGGVA